jgi:hypothetical protein
MLKLGKLRRSDSRAILERVPATGLTDLRGHVQAIGRSQAVIEFALDGTIQTANENFLQAVGLPRHVGCQLRWVGGGLSRRGAPGIGAPSCGCRRLSCCTNAECDSCSCRGRANGRCPPRRCVLLLRRTRGEYLTPTG